MNSLLLISPAYGRGFKPILPGKCCENPALSPKFVEKPEIFPETEFLALGLGQAPRRRESVVMYKTGQLKTVARKKAVNSPGDQKA